MFRKFRKIYNKSTRSKTNLIANNRLFITKSPHPPLCGDLSHKGRGIKILLFCSSLIVGSALCAAPSKEIVVAPDDTVYGIAYEQGILTRSLISANNLKPPYALVPGQVLVIPAPNDHIAGTGETLKTIAEMHGVNVDVLAQENSLLPSYNVKPGDVLLIPPRDTESLAAVLAPTPSEITTTSLAPLPLVKVEQNASGTSTSANSSSSSGITRRTCRRTCA